MMNDVISKIIELDKLSRKLNEKFTYQRYLYSTLVNDDSKVFKAVLGPRGIGKTVLMQQICRIKENSIYFSADTIDSQLDLFEFVKILHTRYGYKYFFIDEIHMNQGHQKALKEIYDFLDISLFFTSSMSLSIIGSSIDLSRRVQLFELHLLSFKEYLELKGEKIEALTINDLINNNYSMKLRRYENEFENYLKGGCLPYSVQVSDIIKQQQNILKTIIEKDIPAVYPVTSQDIYNLHKLVNFIATSGVDGINYSSISSNLSITKYKAQQYVSYLEVAYILNVSTPHGSNVTKEPKILLYLPNRLIFNTFDNIIGGLREDFATSMFRKLGMKYSYLKTTRGKKTPDFFFIVNNKKIVCEIGGKNKGHNQFKELKDYDYKIIFKHGLNLKENDMPLFLLGLVD